MDIRPPKDQSRGYEIPIVLHDMAEFDVAADLGYQGVATAGGLTRYEQLHPLTEFDCSQRIEEDGEITQAVPLPLLGTTAGFRRFSVAEYHKLLDIGLLTENDNLELIEGYLVLKMSRNPPHDRCIHLALRMLLRCLPPDWSVRIQSAITLGDSEPEPDLAVVRGEERTYAARHPSSVDVGVVIEVADSTLLGDRADKARLYARAGIASYWIINLIDRQVEVYSSPSSSGNAPNYGHRINYGAGDQVPLMLHNSLVTSIAVRDLLP